MSHIARGGTGSAAARRAAWRLVSGITMVVLLAGAPLAFAQSQAINGTIEAPEWRTDRAKPPAGKAGCLSKGGFGRAGSHSGVPQGFGQNGPGLRQEAL